MKLIPDSLQTQPVFLCVDDTMVSKFGTKFENVSKLFDHAAHNGSNYLNGHCFVSVMLCVPVWNRDKVSYLSVPLGYRMWQKKESKLELAASMIRQVMPEFHSKDHVIILCDSWYTKQNLVSIVDEYPNLDLIFSLSRFEFTIDMIESSSFIYRIIAGSLVYPSFSAQYFLRCPEMIR